MLNTGSNSPAPSLATRGTLGLAVLAQLVLGAPGVKTMLRAPTELLSGWYQGKLVTASGP